MTAPLQPGARLDEQVADPAVRHARSGFPASCVISLSHRTTILSSRSCSTDGRIWMKMAGVRMFAIDGDDILNRTIQRPGLVATEMDAGGRTALPSPAATVTSGSAREAVFTPVVVGPGFSLRKPRSWSAGSRVLGKRARHTRVGKDGAKRLSPCHSPGGWGQLSPGSWGQVTGIEDRPM